MKFILNGTVAVVDGDTHHAKWIEEAGRLDHDQWLLERIRPYIKEGDTVLDVGANIGTHTIAYLNWVGGKGRVLAFEANWDAVDCLYHNCPLADIIACAIGDVDGEYAATIKNPNVGATHVVRVARSEITADYDTGPLTGLWTLDRIAASRQAAPAFIKMDIEGFEVAALKGAVKTIKEHKPIMLIEVNRGALVRAGTSVDELYDLVSKYGYTTQIVQTDLTRDAEQYDILCQPA